MGYVRDTVYNLHFEDMEGLEVKVKSMSVGEYQAARVLLRKFGAEKDPSVSDGLQLELFREFAARLISWNVETSDGETTIPVPATIDGVLSQDNDFVWSIAIGWIGTISGVNLSAPLVPRSPTGPRLEVASIPMETLSESQAS